MDGHLIQPEQLHHVVDMLRVAPEPVDVFDDEDPDLPRSEHLERRLQARPLHRRARDPVIAVEAEQIEAMRARICFGEEVLVIDRRRALVRVIEALAAIGDGWFAHDSLLVGAAPLGTDGMILTTLRGINRWSLGSLMSVSC
nr:hypothetical protein [Sphingomonas glacialis]